MAERSLRAMRLGVQSLQSEEGVEYAARKKLTYKTADDVTFDVTFARDVEAPEVWEDARYGVGRLLDDDGNFVGEQPAAGKEARSHWDMLLERRTREELEEILQERLEYLRARRGTA